MDPLTRFNSVGRRAPSTPAQPQADPAREARRRASPTSVTTRAWPPTTSVVVDEDEVWDAVIARAKMQASALPTVTRRPQPAPPPHLRPELQVTPPPVPVRQAPMMGQLHTHRIRTAEEVRAKLDIIVRGSANRSAALRPAPRARRTAEEDMVTPPPLRTDGRAAGSRTRR